MRNLLERAGTTMVAVVLLSGCSSSTSNPGDGDGNQSVMSGTIDGGSWTGSTVICSRSGNTVNITARDAQNREVTISIASSGSTGTFNIGSSQPATVTYNYAGQAWAGHLAGATGSVIITTLTSTYMIGSYNLTLQPLTSSATGSKILVGTFTGYFGQT